MDDIIGAIISIAICVVLPVAIVWIASWARAHAIDKRADVMIKAIEANKEVDTEQLVESLKAPQKSEAEILRARLQRGLMYSLIGLVLLIIGVVSWIAGAEFGSESVSIPMIFGGIAMAIGVSYLITYQVSRKQSETSYDK